MRNGVGRYNLRLYAGDYIEYNQEKELFYLLNNVTNLNMLVSISFWHDDDAKCETFNNRVLKNYFKMYPSAIFELYNSDNYFRFAWFDMINSRLSTRFDKYKFRYSYNNPESFKSGITNFGDLLNTIFKINSTNEGHSKQNGADFTSKNRNIRFKHIPTAKSN